MNTLFCSFCGLPEEQTQVIISGKTGHICDDCAEQVVTMSRDELKRSSQEEKSEKKQSVKDSVDWNFVKPTDLKAHLDQYVIGQERAKQVLSVAVYNHYKRLSQEQNEKNKTEEDVEIEKSNMIMLGPSGVGKTLLVQTIARKLGVACVIADATSLTQEGYVGLDPDSIVLKAYQAAGKNIKEAERSIIYIDEFDKLRSKSDNPSITRDVGGEGVQEALLKILEGTEVNISPQGGRKHPEQKLIPINTHNILFICGGAFEGIDKVIEARMNKQSIGFRLDGKPMPKVNQDNLIAHASSEDLKKFGLIPEIVGRLPIVVGLQSLTIDMLRKILTQPKNALIKQYQKLFGMEDITLRFSHDALDYISKKSLEYGMGARSLRGILETTLMDAMFFYPSNQEKKDLLIDKNYVVDKLNKANKTA